MPVIIQERLTAIEGHAESFLTGKYTTPGGKNQEYLFILREIDAIDKWLKKISKDLHAYEKICEVVNEGAPPELVLKRIKRIVSLAEQSRASSCHSSGIPSPNEKGKETNKNVTSYTLDSTLLSKLFHKTIDLFLKYQYQNGFEEPKAREQTIMNILGMIKAAGGQRKRSMY